MRIESGMIEQVKGDIETICDTHKFSFKERERLTNIILRLVPANRDLPLFLLAKKLVAFFDQEVDRSEAIFLLLAGVAESQHFSNFDLGLLDFLISMDDYALFDTLRVEGGLWSAQELARLFSRYLYRYQSARLESVRFTSEFEMISNYLDRNQSSSKAKLKDGDAIYLWVAKGTVEHWVKYETVLLACIDYDHAAMVASTWDIVCSGDEPWQHYSENTETSIVAESIAQLSACHLKCWKGVELSFVKQLASLGQHAYHWPISCQALVSFGALQNKITQGLREGGKECSVKFLGTNDFGISTYENNTIFLEHLLNHAKDCVSLFQVRKKYPLGSWEKLVEGMCEDRRIRAQKILRRSSFKEASKRKVLIDSDSLISWNQTLVIFLEKLAQAFKSSKKQLFEEHRKIFLNKFKELYI